MQSSIEKGLRVGGEKIQCRRSYLNLHMGKGKNGGSVGWVMHEYTIAAPPCPSLVKICHIVFTGHGRKHKRVPDDQEDCQVGHASQRARVDATAAGGCSGAGLDHDSAEQDSSPFVLTEDDIFPQSPLLDSSNFLGVPSAVSANAEQCHELEQQVPSTEVQQVMVPQLMVQQSGIGEQLFPGELEFWTSIGVDVQSNQSLLLGSSDFLGFPSSASANAEQCQELEQQVPSTEEQQIMVPQLMVQQSSMAEQLYTGELEFWSSIGAESNSVLPHIGNLAGDRQDQQDFWSLSRADVRSNCAVPAMAAGALGGAHWGGYCITC